MTSFDQMFPSKYLSASDLDGEPMRVTISGLEPAQMRDGTTKYVLSFDGQKKGLILNVTNGKTLAKGFGKDSGLWLGKEVELYAIDTEYSGEPCKGLRLRKPDMIPAMDPNDDIPASVAGESPF